jgi:hypothetical protein
LNLNCVNYFLAVGEGIGHGTTISELKHLNADTCAAAVGWAAVGKGLLGTDQE